MNPLTLCSTIKKPEDIAGIIEKYKNVETKSKKTGFGKNVEVVKYFEIVASFDIETTSYYKNDQKRAIMYIWQMDIHGETIIGRTWDSFIETINTISDVMNTDLNNRFVIYVHNLAYEFGFIAQRFNWAKTFALKKRNIIKAVTDEGIEFRCSYALSSLALKYLPDQIANPDLKVAKMVGDLDYKLIRNAMTPLTAKEMEYCINDVKLLSAYIYSKAIQDGGIAKIKMTNTGYVRDHIRKQCLSSTNAKQWKNYSSLMQCLTLTAKEYLHLKKAFGGGYTHASARTSGQTLKDITSYDFASSYPAVMLAERFPMSRGEQIKIKSVDDIKELRKRFNLVFTAEFKNVELKDDIFDCYISDSKCEQITSDKILDNGRVFSASSLKTTITEVDFDIIERAYNFTDVKFTNCYRYFSAYLPKAIIDSILYFYEGKTTLKEVEGFEVEYNRLKGMLNSSYGMMVTDIVRTLFEYSTIYGWTEEEGITSEKIEQYNNSKNRFLFYPWGVFVTAYARRNLWEGIVECGEDYHYSDTDSIKISNADKHQKFINDYNKKTMEKLQNMCYYYNIDENKLHPKNKKGDEKWIGIWDFDGHYDEFKTLGAKRYLCRSGEEFLLTISGVAKSGVDYMVKTFGPEKMFEAFSDDLLFPAGSCGVSTHTYIDEEFTDAVTDYMGNTYIHNEKNCIHLEETSYSLTMSDEYVNLIENYLTIRTEEVI